jgi:2-polyprenyl-3-methyl-5-hydroxy-6-metoxy-1,4-benzoquinol methylase
MPESKTRLAYPGELVYVLGGFLGAVVNLVCTFLLYQGLHWSPLAAFFCGTLANELFHHAYYRVVYVNQEIQIRTSLSLHLFLYLLVAVFGAALFNFFLIQLKWNFLLSFISSLAVLAATNTLLIRISTFSSARLAEVEYREMNESYYDDQTDEKKVSRFRAWYHRSRYERLCRFVEEYYRRGMRIADLGCANCRWNSMRRPVTGADINEKMLRWAKENRRLKDYHVTSSLACTGLKTKRFDIVLMSETLEHILDLRGTLAEAKRILKDNGTLLLTVPYDFFLGPFFILFNLNCVYRGYFRGSRYHKFRCGHVHHFTKGRLKSVLQSNGFELKRCFVVNGLLLYAAAQKKEAARGGLFDKKQARR